MKSLIAILLGIHAVGHLAGALWPWWIIESLPYGKPDAGSAQVFDDTSLRMLSVMWLATGVAFGIAALTRALGARAWKEVTAVAAVASLVLSVAWWPGSLLGAPIDLAILAMLRVAWPSYWPPPRRWRWVPRAAASRRAPRPTSRPVPHRPVPIGGGV